MVDDAAERVILSAYGCSIAVAVPTADVPRLLGQLPPGYARQGSPSEVQRTWSVLPGPDGGLQGFVEGGLLVADRDLSGVLQVLLADVELWVAEHSPERIFVHAGCVAFDGRVIVLPGRTMTGKSTLVAELVAMGATYFSDEFALLDADGLVWPYPRPVVLRPGGPGRSKPAAPSPVAPTESRLPIGVVCDIRYDPEVGWKVEEVGHGGAVLSIIGNCVAARSRSEAVLSSAVRATRGAVGIVGIRDEAEAAARRLLEYASTVAAGDASVFVGSAP